MVLWQPRSEFALYNALACHKKPYSICLDDGKVKKANRKSFFRNKLQKSTLTCVSTCIVEVSRAAQIITMKEANPSLLLTWARKVFKYIERLPGSAIHIVFNNYNNKDFLIYLKDALQAQHAEISGF